MGNIVSLVSKSPGLLSLLKTNVSSIATAIIGVMSAAGLLKAVSESLSDDEQEQITEAARVLNGQPAEPSVDKTGDYSKELGLNYAGNVDVKEEEISFASIVQKSVGEMMNFVNSNRIAAYTIVLAVLVAIWKKDELAKTIGDILAPILAKLGFEDLAASVDNWGEDASGLAKPLVDRQRGDIRAIKLELAELKVLLGLHSEYDVVRIMRLIKKGREEEYAAYLRNKEVYS